LRFSETSFFEILSDVSSSDVEDTNKLLLERNTQDIASRIRRSPNTYDSNMSLERPIIATPISDRTITENSSSVKFTCSILSTECDISWEKNGIPIRSTSKYRQTFSPYWNCLMYQTMMLESTVALLPIKMARASRLPN